MRFIVCFMLAASVLLAAVAWADSSCTETVSRIGSALSQGTVKTLTLDWEAAEDSTFTDYETSAAVTGRIIQVVTIPDTSDTGLRMADNYDIALKTADGEDIFGGALSNRDSVSTERAQPLLGSLVNTEAWTAGPLTLSISNLYCAGSKGRVKIYWIAR